MYEVLKVLLFHLQGPYIPIIYKNNIVQMFTATPNSELNPSDPTFGWPHHQLRFQKRKEIYRHPPKIHRKHYFFRIKFHLVNSIWVGVSHIHNFIFVCIPIHPIIWLVTKDGFACKNSKIQSRILALSIIINSKVLGQLNLVRVQAQVLT